MIPLTLTCMGVDLDWTDAWFAAHHHHKLCTVEVKCSMLNKPHSQNNNLSIDTIFYLLYLIKLLCILP